MILFDACSRWTIGSRSFGEIFFCYPNFHYLARPTDLWETSESRESQISAFEIFRLPSIALFSFSQVLLLKCIDLVLRCYLYSSLTYFDSSWTIVGRRLFITLLSQSYVQSWSRPNTKTISWKFFITESCMLIR